MIYHKGVKVSPSYSESGLSRLFYTVLLSLSGALIALLALGTIYAFVRSPGAGPLFRLGGSGGTGSRETTVRTGDTRVYSGLRQLRIPLVNSSTLVLSIAFPYSADDAAFAEELNAKLDDFRTIAISYFSGLPAEDLRRLDEDAVKRELLRRFNENLRLGRIPELYFSDLMIID